MKAIVIREQLLLYEPEVGIIINCEHFPGSTEISCTVTNQKGSDIMHNGHQQKSICFKAFYGDILTTRDTYIIFLIPGLPRTAHAYDVYELEKIISFIEKSMIKISEPEKLYPTNNFSLFEHDPIYQILQIVGQKYFGAEKRMQVSLQLKIERGPFEILYVNVICDEDDKANCENNGSYGGGCFHGNMQSESLKFNENNQKYISTSQCEPEADDEEDNDAKINRDDDDDETKILSPEFKKRDRLVSDNGSEPKRSEFPGLAKRVKMQSSISSGGEDIKSGKNKLVPLGSPPKTNFSQGKSKGFGAPLLYNQSYDGCNIASNKLSQSDLPKPFNGPYGQPQTSDLNNMSSNKFPTTSLSSSPYNCPQTVEAGGSGDVASSATKSQNEDQDPSPPPCMRGRNRMCFKKMG